MSLFRYVGEDKADVQLDFEGFTMMKQLSARCLEVKHEVSDTSMKQRNKYRQIRHGISEGEGDGVSLPGIKPQFG